MASINLSKFVPFDLEVDRETNLVVKAGDIKLKYSVRRLFDMKEVIYDKVWLAKQKENFDLYYMYRDLTREEDKALFQKHAIRFDVTIIPPNDLGMELVKTAGHFHPEVKDGVSFPEVYEVMHGKGEYLLQKTRTSGRSESAVEAIDLVIISAKVGEQVLIPPGYGHITINPSKDEPLIMNNLVSANFSSIYGPIKNKRGAAYLLLQEGKWIKNPAYEEELTIKKLTAAPLFQKPFYHSFLEKPDEWSFLNRPWERKQWL